MKKYFIFYISFISFIYVLYFLFIFTYSLQYFFYNKNIFSIILPKYII